MTRIPERTSFGSCRLLSVSCWTRGKSPLSVGFFCEKRFNRAPTRPRELLSFFFREKRIQPDKVSLCSNRPAFWHCLGRHFQGAKEPARRGVFHWVHAFFRPGPSWLHHALSSVSAGFSLHQVRVDCKNISPELSDFFSSWIARGVSFQTRNPAIADSPTGRSILHFSSASASTRLEGGGWSYLLDRWSK
jgi:hypothetical protein